MLCTTTNFSPKKLYDLNPSVAPNWNRTPNLRTYDVCAKSCVLFWEKGVFVLWCVRARYLLGWVCSRFLQVGCWTRTERLIKIVARSPRRYQLTVLGDKVVLSAARPIAARLTSRSFQTEEMRDVGEWVCVCERDTHNNTIVPEKSIINIGLFGRASFGRTQRHVNFNNC